MNDNEMDGGITMVDGRKMRIVLDFNGVFVRTEETKLAPAAPTAMDAATRAAVASMPAALTMQPAPGTPESNAPAGAAPGAGFKAPM